jgi:O-6-methylguanine DNA methyltransferase
LISFEYKDKDKITILDEIKFFEKETHTVAYIKEKKLELIQEKDITNNNTIQSLQNLILSYLSGKNVNLYNNTKDLNIDLGIEKKFPTEFSRRVIRNLVNLDRGEVTSYSDIGNRMGSKAFRAIGNILRRNPLPLIIPCHRVIKKNGGLGGFMGESDRGWQLNLKKGLLEIEQLTDS